MNHDFADLKRGTPAAAERQRYVADLFGRLAPRYDRFNRWVSFFRDERWRKETVACLQERANGVVLDLAAGTGDLAQVALAAGARHVHAFDISYEMLKLAKQKLLRENESGGRVAVVQGSAERLPYRTASFDGVVSGFAMRNVFHFLDDVLRETQRVLKPGGRVAILELSRPRNSVLRFGFRLHMKTVMPLVGRLATGQSEPFQYLYQTTMTYLSPEAFRTRLECAGFEDVGFQTYLFGGIAIHSARKPAA